MDSKNFVSYEDMQLTVALNELFCAMKLENHISKLRFMRSPNNSMWSFEMNGEPFVVSSLPCPPQETKTVEVKTKNRVKKWFK